MLSICTSAHILGACKVSLAQGRFTYRHDSVLTEIVSSLNTFLDTYEPHPSPVPFKINFVKAGSKPRSSKKLPLVGILHHASDWKLLSDCNSSLVIPPFITISTLRPDILLYSTKTRTVVIVELTCPCEENMETWHTKKFDKYASLCADIKLNRWSVHLFAIEVGARGYCSETVRNCFRRLGLNNKVSRSTIKSISSIAMRCSFEIWMARNSRVWLPCVDTPPSCSKSFPSTQNLTSRAKKTINSRSFAKKIPEKSILNTAVKEFPEKSVLNTSVEDVLCPPVLLGSDLNSLQRKTMPHMGLLNKGNTCYANSILQCFSAIQNFWSHLTPEQSSKSSFLGTFQKIMSSIRISKRAIDPSSFLVALQSIVIKSGNTKFEFNKQQDASEVLEHVINELSKNSIVASEMLKVQSKTTSTCDFCSYSQEREVNSVILHLPVSNSVQASLLRFLQSGQDESFCHACSLRRNMATDHAIISCSRYVIIELNRFCTKEGLPEKFF